MQKVEFTNKGQGPAYKLVDGVTRIVNPGETLMVDLPADAKKTADAPAVAPPPKTDADKALEELQSKPIAEIQEVLPALSLAELEALLALEQKSSKPRSTLVKEIETSILATKTSS
jgi:hypothetical protein